MSLNIKNEETHRLAAQLADMLGTSMTESVTLALREKIEREKSTKDQIKKKKLQKIRALVRKFQALPSYDNRSADEILGYNDKGHFD